MITEKSISELAELLNKGELSSEEIVSAYIERTEKLNKDINAFITIEKELALKAAVRSDERRRKGAPLSPYDGIPVAVKDNINVDGMPTTCGSKMLEGYMPPFTAGACEKMLQKGFIITGKTNLDEFAMGSTTESSFFGPTKNPFDFSRVPGGSSGGSAAAVSARMAPAALGSDTGGSIRQPAAFCGVAGVKPTYGRVSRYGLVAFASSLDQIGTFGTDVRDAAILLEAVSGRDPRDATSIDMPADFTSNLDGDVSALTIGVPEEYFAGIDSEIASATEKRISDLQKKGAKIKKVSLKYTEYAIPIYYIIATAEASSNLARYDGVRYGYRSPESDGLEELYVNSRSRGLGEEVKRRIMLGTFVLSSGYYDAYYLKALKGRQLIIDDFKGLFSDVDALVTPVTTSAAFKAGEMTKDPLKMYMSDVLTISVNLAGLPGMSVPAGLSKEGLPIGVQIICGHFQEKKLLRTAAALEECCGPIHPKLPV